MRYIDPSIHKFILVKLQEVLANKRHLHGQINNADIGGMQQNSEDLAELHEMYINLAELFDLYKVRRDELVTLSEKYLQLQQKVRIILRKQQIQHKKYTEMVNKESTRDLI